MELLFDPQTWLSFATLALLEIVLGIDNIIFLSILVDRLPQAQRRSARFVGMGFAMLTRIGLLFCVIWLANLREPLFALFGKGISSRNLILFSGGSLLVVKSGTEIRDLLSGRSADRNVGMMDGFWLIILQIGVIDIVFSLDSVFTAIGLANRVEVMVAAIVVSVLMMMMVSAAVSGFIERHPAIKGLALAFLVMVGASLIAESLDVQVPRAYLYCSMALAAAAVWTRLRLRLRRRG
jgi:predicted tellurium resistance membrane protein TerC